MRSSGRSGLPFLGFSAGRGLIPFLHWKKGYEASTPVIPRLTTTRLADYYSKKDSVDSQ